MTCCGCASSSACTPSCPRVGQRGGVRGPGGCAVCPRIAACVATCTAHAGMVCVCLLEALLLVKSLLAAARLADMGTVGVCFVQGPSICQYELRKAVGGSLGAGHMLPVLFKTTLKGHGCREMPRCQRGLHAMQRITPAAWCMHSLLNAQNPATQPLSP